MKTSTVLLSTTAAMLFIAGSALALEPWVAPASAKNKVNSYSNDPAAVVAGKKLFIANCVICHGNAGKGDGPGAAALNPKPANFSDPKVNHQTDGELFWKVSEGRGAMIAWKAALNDPQRWQIVNYIRSIAPRK